MTLPISTSNPGATVLVAPGERNLAFGLNALGGAIDLQMKNGFTFKGFEGEIMGGSYGRINTSCNMAGRRTILPSTSLRGSL